MQAGRILGQGIQRAVHLGLELLGREGLLQQEMGALGLGLELVLGRDLEAQQRQMQRGLDLAQALVELDARQRRLGEPVGDQKMGLEEQALGQGRFGVGAAEDAVGRETMALQQLARKGLHPGQRIYNKEFQGVCHGRKGRGNDFAAAGFCRQRRLRPVTKLRSARTFQRELFVSPAPCRRQKSARRPSGVRATYRDRGSPPSRDSWRKPSPMPAGKGPAKLRLNCSPG